MNMEMRNGGLLKERIKKKKNEARGGHDELNWSVDKEKGEAMNYREKWSLDPLSSPPPLHLLPLLQTS